MPSKKKILFHIGDGVYPFHVGGMEVFNYYIIRKLAEKFCVYYTASQKYDFCGARFLRCFNMRPSKLFTPLQLLFHLFLHPSIKTVVFSYSSAHWIVFRLYYLITFLLRREYIVVVHYGKDPDDLYVRKIGRFFRTARTVIAVSTDIKRKYDIAYGINCIVIFPLVPFEKSTQSKRVLREKYSIPIDANVVCMVGTIKSMKNPDTILHVLKSFSETELTMYNPFIVYAGAGDMLSDMERYVRDNNLIDRVIFLGFVPKERVNEVYGLSDVYLIASDFEGTSVSLLEAMYNEKVIIASKAPGIVDTIREGECLMYQVRNEQELKRCFINAVSDANGAKMRAAAASKRFETEYSFQTILDTYIKILS